MLSNALGSTARKLVMLTALAAIAAPALTHTVFAQGGTGTITGRVAWCTTYPFALPLAPGAAESGAAEGGFPGVMPPEDLPVPLEAEPAAPDADVQGAPGIVRPIPGPRPFPAGAVLVAVQGTGLSTRTDENGRFSLAGVPVGTYYTIAAGPVAAAAGAAAIRPSAILSPGQTQDVGVLYLTVQPNAMCQR